MTRDWDNPEYKKWRKAVRKRDGYKCQMPKCGSKKNIKVHHILTWAKYPHLRFDVKNGICLCRVCHDSISKQEHHYARMFIQIVRNKNG
jgi:5-methylcytosine-specific restriction endonuclease McrA